jgi:integrase
MRRTKGQGTIYHRETASGVVFKVKVTRDGVVDYAAGNFKTKREAEKALAELLKTPRGARSFPALAEYIDRLLSTRFASRAVYSPTTWETTESALRVHVRPRKLGVLRLDLIRKIDVQDFVSELSDAGLKASTVRRIGAIVSVVLSNAVEDGYLQQNPAFGVKYPVQEEVEKRVMSFEEAAKLPGQVASPRLSAMFLVSVETGLRRGELCGLKWADVCEEKSDLRVRTAIRIVDGQMEEGPVKEKKSKPAIPLTPDALKSMLSQPRRSQYVFTTEDGYPVRPDNLTRDWQQFRARMKKRGIDLGKMRLHDLRATFITLNLVNGTDVRTVSELVGHSNPAFTLQKYARSTTALKEAAIDKLKDKLTEARALPESWPKGTSQIQKMVGGTGFEPVTPTVSL